MSTVDPRIQAQHEMIVKAATRERNFILCSFLALTVLMGFLQLQVWRNTNGLRETQQQRCMERNEDTLAILEFIERQIPRPADRAEIEEQLAPLDCGVYDR